MVFAVLAPGEAPLSSSPAIPRPRERPPAFWLLRERRTVDAVFVALDRFL